MNKNEKSTRNKLEKLSKALNGYEYKKEEKPKKVYTSSFKTSEVVILLLLTCVVSLLMGGVVVYKVTENKGKKIDKELQEFIENYDYITESYYGEVDKSKLIDSAITGMLTTLDKNSSYVGDVDDDFSVYLEGKYKGIGIQVYNDKDKNVIVYAVFDGSPAAKAGLKEGDIITKINDTVVLNKTTEEVSNIIKKQKTEFTITYKRDDKEKTVKIKLSDVPLTSVSSTIINKNNTKVGYISVSIFANNTAGQFKTELTKLEKENIKSLIIDLRDNSGGHLSAAEGILSLFLDSSHPIYQIKSKESKSKYYSKGKTTKKYKIVILVNGSSASASEVTTSALMEQYGAISIGEKTYGKGTVQELQTLPSGERYKLTTKQWLTSKGKEVEGIGIIPTIEEKLNEKYEEEPSDENDNQLQKAIEEALK